MRKSGTSRVRVVYSFPHRLGADRISHTAWQQVNGLAAAGAEVTVFAASLQTPLAEGVQVYQTLARGNFRIPYRILGSKRAFALHDFIVSQKLEKLRDGIDIVHTWPLGARRTLTTAIKLRIPTVLERPNAHTRYAMEVVKRECDLLGISMPPGHEHAEDQEKVDIETEEYELTDRLLCPSDFVARTFIDSGYSWERLARHQYGFDEKIYYPTTETRNPKLPFSMLFVGGCAPRKGLHYALDAWLQSPAHKDGRFLIAGAFIPEYQEKLRSMLSHPSVEVLGHRNDIPELMRGCDVLVLPTVEEGSALVTSEARGSGCVLLVSDAAGAVCEHMENALIHRAGDVCSLTQHITLLYENRDLLGKLRRASLLTRHEITWKAAGIKLLQVYQEIIASQRTDKRYSCSAEQFPL